MARRSAIAKCAEAWNELAAQQAAEWIQYAKATALKDNLKGECRSVVDYKTFIALIAKRLQSHPDSRIRTHSPTHITTAATSPSTHDCKKANSSSLHQNQTPNTRRRKVSYKPFQHLERSATLIKYQSLEFVNFASTNTFSIPLPTNTITSAIAHRFLIRYTGQQIGLEPLPIVLMSSNNLEKLQQEDKRN